MQMQTTEVASVHPARTVARRKRPGTVRMASPSELGFEERIALMVCAFAKGNEEALLAGLSAAQQKPAMRIARELVQLSSAARRSRMAHVFSEREEAMERSRRLVSDANPALRSAILAALPPYLRPAGAGMPARSALGPLSVMAARLVKEASR